jgi:hypothetical protein
MLPYPWLNSIGKPSMPRALRTHGDLCDIWNTLSRFCDMVNDDETKVSEDLLLDTMGSDMYRLLGTCVAKDSTEEAIRLAMLSFCARIFLHWRQVQVPLTWLREQFTGCIVGLLREGLVDRDEKLALWLLLVHGSTFSPWTAEEFGVLQPWLAYAIKRGDLTAWDGVRAVVKSYLWIGVACDDSARHVVKSCCFGTGQLS